MVISTPTWTIVKSPMMNFFALLALKRKIARREFYPLLKRKIKLFHVDISTPTLRVDTFFLLIFNKRIYVALILINFFIGKTSSSPGEKGFLKIISQSMIKRIYV